MFRALRHAKEGRRLSSRTQKRRYKSTRVDGARNASSLHAIEAKARTVVGRERKRERERGEEAGLPPGKLIPDLIYCTKIKKRG